MGTTYNFSIDGRDFVAAKLDGRKQLDVLKRMLPIFGSVVMLWSKLPAQIAAVVPKPEGAEDAEQDAEARENAEKDRAAFGELIAATILRVSELSDASSKFVFDTCLNAVSLKQGDRLVKIMTGDRFQFDDLDDGATILAITVQVLKHEFTPFFIKARGDLIGALLSQK